jgi:gliding motility-associatede transport system auxiliary component
MNKETVGKILGALGLVLVITAPFTWWLLDAGTPALLKLGVGVLFLATYVVTNFNELGKMASGRGAFFIAFAATLSAVTLALLVFANYIVADKNKTWDITSKKVNSLAPQTTSALTGLKEKVTALAFAEPKDPMYGVMEGLLQRYRAEAPDKFDFAFKAPLKSPDLVSKYQLRQGQDAIVLTRGEGASESHVMVPVPTEQELTNGLLKLSSVGEKKVYFLVGHGEWTLEGNKDAEVQDRPGNDRSILELHRDLTQEGYAPQTLNLLGKADVPKDCSVLIVAGPKQGLTPPEVEAIKKYLAEGGRLALFVDEKVETGLDKVLADFGLQVDPGMVADTQFPVESPYDIPSLYYGTHEITRLLRSAPLNTEFITTRGITILRDGVPAGVKAEPLVLTSPQAWEELTPDQDPKPSNGEKTGQIAIAAVSVKPVSGDVKDKRNDEARVALFGDSTMLVDTYWGHEGNRNLVLNAIAWASNQFQKVTIRPPDRDISTVDLDTAGLARIRLLSTDLLPLTVLGLGLAIWLTRRNK